MASAVAASQANDLIANGASEPCVANTTTGSCAGAVARAAAGTVRLFARSALPPGVANAVTAALAYSVPAAVVKFLARHHLAAVQPSEPQSTAGAVVGSPNLFERVRICVADLVHWPQGQAHCKHGNGKTDGEWLHIMPSPRVHFSAAIPYRLRKAAPLRPQAVSRLCAAVRPSTLMHWRLRASAASLPAIRVKPAAAVGFVCARALHSTV